MQAATPKHGAIGGKWQERGSRVIEIVERVDDKQQPFKVYDPAVPGYVKRQIPQAVWKCAVGSFGDGRVAGRKRKTSTSRGRTVLIRDDVLGRLWTKVPAS